MVCGIATLFIKDKVRRDQTAAGRHMTGRVVAHRRVCARFGLGARAQVSLMTIHTIGSMSRG